MGKRQPVKTTIKEAVDYWSRYIDENDLSIDWSEAHTHCWRCGCERNLQRCHIIPDALGGKDEPSNIVLLCKRCHADGPNVSDPDIMWDWIKAYAVPVYDIFWMILAFREYQFIYHRTFTQEIVDIYSAAGIDLNDDSASGLLQEITRDISERASKHYGQPYFNTATIAGMFRVALKEFAGQYHVQFPVEKQEETGDVEKSWWFKA